MNSNCSRYPGRIGLILAILGGTSEILMKLFGRTEPTELIAIGLVVIAGSVLFVIVGV
jgi:hypothetical protein